MSENTTSTNPTRDAARVWAELMRHHPALAAALAVHLRQMPDDWPLRLFGAGRPDAALDLPPTPPGRLPEIAPVDPDASMEDCPACGERIEADLPACRYHAGWNAGYRHLKQPMVEAVRIDPTVTVRALLRRLATADEAAARGTLAAAVDALLRDSRPEEGEDTK